MKWLSRRDQPAYARTDFATGDWVARFENRSLDDIRVLGRNSPADDRAFAAAARLSEINLSIYRTMMQPMVRAFATQPMADFAHSINPLRLSYTMFADSNPWMQGMQTLAANVTAARSLAAADNPFLALQTHFSDQIIAGLDAYRVARDKMSEQIFFSFYGSPFVQALLGINEDSEVRPAPDKSLAKIGTRAAQADAYAAKLQIGGFDEALTRAVLYVIAADRGIDQRCAFALNVARKKLMHLSIAEFKFVVRDQFFVLQLEPDRALNVLASLVPKAGERNELLKQVRAIVSADGSTTAAECERLARVSKLLGMPVEKTITSAASGRTAVATATARV